MRAERASAPPGARTRTGWLAIACAGLMLACSRETLSLGSGHHGSRDAGTSAEDDFAPATVVEVSAVKQDKDDDPSLTSDLTLLYFDSRRTGGAGREDIWLSQRASDGGGTWSMPSPVSELNTSARETGIALVADGLSIWFSSDRDGGSGGLDIYVAERPDRGTPFGAPVLVESLSSAGDDLISFVDPTQTTAFLARRTDADDDYDLYLARRDSRELAWQAATALSHLNTDAGESDAFAVQAGARLLFTRAGDLYLAARDGSGGYADPQPLTSVNSEQDDRDPWATEDLSYLMFSSKRSGSYLFYEAHRP